MFISWYYILFFIINIILTEKVKINIRKLNLVQRLELKVIGGKKVKIINSDYAKNIANIYINGKSSSIDSSGNIQNLELEENNVIIEWSIKFEKYTKLFKNIDTVIEIDFTNFDNTGISLISNMFINCANLKYIKFNNFNTLSVYDMTSMFEDCPSLESLDLSSFDTSNVLYMENMFKNCKSLISLTLSNFYTPKIM